MIYLIGGSPRVGKTIIAKKFVEDSGLNLISTDDLEDQKQKDPSMQSMPIFYKDPKKNKLSPKERTKLIIREIKELYEDIDRILQQNAHEDILIEGVHLLPEYIDKKQKEFGKENVRSVIIGSINPRRILQGMTQNTDSSNWHKSFPEESLKQIAEFSSELSKYLIEESKKENIQYFERTSNFGKDIQEIINKIK